ncbi:CheY-like protein [Fragilariopsis cylindrus CCMP1102]|uniref:CheY-like protein n=1 Tax=Fragilariopsis cylindrus CCMP1102 TaxID=635003 RepID=A0A1E7F4Z4_9STRA|nr:CheY-like protein [Fragilariopsis cylindrus CCMP1102]|eukprot:OEU13065.1 CheY-like protein [Fragilariopsis cylindrus CCMP1102]
MSNRLLFFSCYVYLLVEVLEFTVSFTPPKSVACQGLIRRRDREGGYVEIFRHQRQRRRPAAAASVAEQHYPSGRIFLSSSRDDNSIEGEYRRDDQRQHLNPEEILSKRRANSWILLVDDEEPIRRAVGQFFHDKGYQVTTSADGAAAFQLAMSKKIIDNTTGEMIHRFPDCIVSDIRMPVMDGLELLHKIRNDDLLSMIPVVLLTAKGLTQDRIAGYDSGADAYLSKPFSPEELVAIVDNIILRSDNLNVENEIKNLLLNKGGGGIGNGWVEQTNIFLSKDERIILELLSRGLMTKEIAAETHLSSRRVEQLLTEMFRKTEVKNRTQLVRWAVSTGNVN